MGDGTHPHILLPDLTQMVKPYRVPMIQALLALVDDAEMAEPAKQGVFYLSGIP